MFGFSNYETFLVELHIGDELWEYVSESDEPLTSDSLYYFAHRVVDEEEGKLVTNSTMDFVFDLMRSALDYVNWDELLELYERELEADDGAC